ncbi:trichocyst matrix protein, putative (macronuclear) [Tetrahymena thermophila SB210]|uniref:Trichocyst matrix protein, putative n=1 Tax=Tetrahymena thermophila (strain SB210) TaxID=312017 RepID=I7LZH8_TETTS|nr:trichocyst matrix protein, putative [Tetrahymena thermophila SB210]EAR83960.2 trichocyst matrix protein, putative [Tetrahymena thermophila SB210]|eukprot:XP_001031623.2 trichocyst matrix protein, putative [Tetrahymena thermophila SB210]
MKQVAIIGFLLILNITFSQAVFLKRPVTQHFTVFSQLEKIENHSFGKRILDTVALQITNRVPLGEVAKVISEINSDIQSQQQTADSLQAERSRECESEQDRLNSIITDNNAIKTDALENIAILEVEISQLSANIGNKNQQLTLLSDRVSSIQDARSRDNEDFERRSQETEQVIEALNLIIEKVGSISPETSEQEVFLQLAKIGKSNPILSLVSIASTFSQDSLDNVINKLSQLRESLSASLVEDGEAENRAIKEFNKLVSELHSTINSLNLLISSLNNELSQKQASHAFHTSRLNNAEEAISSSQELLKRKVSQCNDWSTQYQSDTQARNEQIDIIEEVQSIVATKLETMKDYLKERAEQ